MTLEMLMRLCGTFQAAGKSSPNFVANLLNSGNTTAEDRHRIKWAAESLYVLLTQLGLYK